MNPITNQDESPDDPKGAQLRQTLEHLTLQKMIDQVDKEDLNIKQLCDLLHTCSGHKKAETAQEKTRSAERIAIQRLNKTNTAQSRLPLRDHNPAQTQPENEQSHEDFCKTLADAAMDIWGVDISDVTQPGEKNSPTSSPTTHSIDENPPHSPSPNPAHTSLPLRDPQESNAAESQDLYDIPPQYRQGAAPIKGSQEKYGQPKYTREQWRKTMHRAIRANYGIHDKQQSTPKPDHPHQTDPAHDRLPLREHNPAATQPDALDKTPPQDDQPAHNRLPLREHNPAAAQRDALDKTPRLAKDAQPRPPP